MNLVGTGLLWCLDRCCWIFSQSLTQVVKLVGDEEFIECNFVFGKFGIDLHFHLSRSSWRVVDYLRDVYSISRETRLIHGSSWGFIPANYS